MGCESSDRVGMAAVSVILTTSGEGTSLVCEISCDFTRFHEISRDITRFHEVSQDFTRTRSGDGTSFILRDFTGFHGISRDFTRFHEV